VDKKGNPSAVQLSVRVTQDSTSSAVAANAIQQAQTSAQQLSQPLVSTMSDAFADISDTMSNQQNLVTSFNALMKRLEPLVKIGDEVAKVCSSVSSSLLDDPN
jgi:phage-related minor tail protein